MKTNKTSFLGLLLLFTSTILFFACSKNENRKTTDELNLKQIQIELNTFYKHASAELNLETGRKEDLSSILRKSYIDLYKNEANLIVFDKTNTASRKSKLNKSNFVIDTFNEIITNSASHEEAIIALDVLINDPSIIQESKLDFIALRETLYFIGNNHKIIEKNIFDKSFSRSNEAIARRGWWDKWGKCAASTLGGAITGATTGLLGGGAVGTIALPGVGTVSGAAVGAIGGGVGGALTGAAAGC